MHILHNISVINHQHIRPRKYGRHLVDHIFKCILLMQMCAFPIKCHRNWFLRVQLTISQHCLKYWGRFGADQATNHFLKQCWLDYQRRYASLGLNELTWFLRNTGLVYSNLVALVYNEIVWVCLKLALLKTMSYIYYKFDAVVAYGAFIYMYFGTYAEANNSIWAWPLVLTHHVLV